MYVCVVVFVLGRLSRKVIFPFSPSFFFFFPLPISFPFFFKQLIEPDRIFYIESLPSTWAPAHQNDWLPASVILFRWNGEKEGRGEEEQ